VVIIAAKEKFQKKYFGLAAWRSGNVFHLINEVTLCWAGLVLWWVTACRQVNHLSHLGQLAFHPSRVGKSSTSLSGWG